MRECHEISNDLPLTATKVVDTFQKNKERTNTSDRLSDAFDHVAKESEKAAPNLCESLTDNISIRYLIT